MKTKTMIAAALALMTASGAASAADFYEGTVNGHFLACVKHDDAICIDKGCADFRTFIPEVVRTGRCVWWQDGDKVIVSPKDHGEEVAARHVEGWRWLFIDGCKIRGAPCMGQCREDDACYVNTPQQEESK